MERLQKLLEVFRSLNPELVNLIRAELTSVATETGPDSFDLIVQMAEEVLAAYLGSPVKNAERALLEQYYYFLEKTSKRMIAQGELPDQSLPANQTSLALVPEHYYDSVQWLQVQSRSEMPAPVADGVDAAKRRNLMVESVLEPLFRLQLEVDPERAFAWQLQLCSGTDTAVDPDVARDLVRAWRPQQDLPPAALQQAIHWSSDEMCLRHWPAVIQESDRLLRIWALRAWVEGHEIRLQQAAMLQKLAPFTDERRLTRWMRNSISQMGESIEFFCEQSEALSAAESDEEQWRQDAMFKEVMWLARMMPPMLLLADLLLSQPNGAFMFAMATFGFTTSYRETWYRCLVDLCGRAVNRWFLRDLRQGKGPLETIHTLSFGDGDFERNLIQELDLVTQSFDSIRQKDLVVERLSHMYASYRETPLMAQEIARRYRRMMRLLHPDNLARLLRPDQLKAVMEHEQVLTDLGTIAAECRRFLAMRRALDKSTDEIIAADLDFTQSIRGLRAAYIRRLLQV